MDELTTVDQAKKPKSVQARIEDPKVLAGGVVLATSVVDLFARASDAVPAWGSPVSRPRYLSDLWRNDSRLSGVVFTMVSRMGSVGWALSGPVDDLQGWYDLFAQADDDWTDFIRLCYLDYLSTDEGSVMETAREWYPDGPVQKLWHMDASRVVPGPILVKGEVYPLLFQDVNTWKTLELGQFYRMCSLPSADQFKRRMGFCFISRVLRYALWAEQIMQYQEEKLSNLPPEGIASVTGLTRAQVENAFREYEQKRTQRQSLIFPGVLWFVANTFGQEASVTFTSFRDVWTGFNDREVNEMFMKVVSLDAGVDVGEFWQVEFHGATKAASWLQHRKAWGKGPAEFVASFERWATRILPMDYHFAFDVPDDEQDQLHARIEAQEIRNIRDMASPLHKDDPQGLISREEGREMLAEQNIIPQRFVLPPERVATDVLRSLTGRDVGTIRWPDRHITRHRQYWELNGPSVLPEFKALAAPPGYDWQTMEAIRKNWAFLETAFSTLLSQWAGDVLSTLKSNPSVLDGAGFWDAWASRIEAEIQDEFASAALDAIETTGLGISFDRANEIAQEVAGEQAFELVQLDGPVSIVRTTRDALDRIRAKLESGELAWVDLEKALLPWFGPARAKKIAVTTNTGVWAESQLRSAKDAGLAEKASVRADYDRPCPSGICDAWEAQGWIGIDEEFEGGFQKPPAHPHCFCYLRTR